MFQRILVPVDLTAKSQAAADMACDLAVQSGAEVILLHVIETIENVEFEELRSFYDRLEKSSKKGLREFSERFIANKVPVQQVLVYGRRAKKIVEAAIANQVDLIIMSSHRVDPDRPGHDWGSISYMVSILAPCSVLLMKQ